MRSIHTRAYKAFAAMALIVLGSLLASTEQCVSADETYRSIPRRTASIYVDGTQTSGVRTVTTAVEDGIDVLRPKLALVEVSRVKGMTCCWFPSPCPRHAERPHP